jgi:hypothetical protein
MTADEARLILGVGKQDNLEKVMRVRRDCYLCSYLAPFAAGVYHHLFLLQILHFHSLLSFILLASLAQLNLMLLVALRTPLQSKLSTAPNTVNFILQIPPQTCVTIRTKIHLGEEHGVPQSLPPL